MGGRAGRPTYKTAVAPVDGALLDSNIYRSYYHRRVVDPDAILVLIGVDGRISELRSMILSKESGDGRPVRRRRKDRRHRFSDTRSLSQCPLLTQLVN